MTLLRITKDHRYLKTILHWYTTSFTEAERRNPQGLIQLINHPDMHLCAILKNHQLVGFIIYWQWPTLIFIEHFVVAPDYRNKQIGQQVLQHMIAKPFPFLILEVEKPVTDINERRILFYKRQGFVLSPYEYKQPPYQVGKDSVPMHLMSIPAIPDFVSFTTFSQFIREQVYEAFY